VEYTEQQKESFRAEFARRRRRQLVASVPAAAVAILVVLSDRRRGPPVVDLSQGVVLPACVIVILAVLAFSWRNWRCPACDAYLGRGTGPRFCPRCAAPLR